MLKGTTTLYFETLLYFIDPETLNIEKQNQVVGDKVGAYGHQHISGDYNYSGLTQEMIINDDNTMTVLMEEDNYGAWGAAGIAELSEDGIEQKGYVINKNQHGEVYLNFYMHEKNKEIYAPDRGDPFVSYVYLHTRHGHYVLFNDAPINFTRAETEEKCKEMYVSSGANGVCYKLGDGKIDRNFLFGDPEKDNGAYFNLVSGDYNNDAGVYATLIIDPDKKHENSSIAWVTFD